MTDQADTAIQFAANQLGKPYEWGATGPNSYDCSGLIQASYAFAGVRLSRTTYTQVHEGQAVQPTQSAMLPGDLVFPDPGHVMLYIGGGRCIEAPHTGANVRVSPLYGMWAVRRIPGAYTGDTGGVTVPGVNQAGYVTPGVQQAVSGAGVIGDLMGLAKFGAMLASPWTWIRLGEILGGAILVFLGFMALPSVRGALGKVGKAAGEAAAVA